MKFFKIFLILLFFCGFLSEYETHAFLLPKPKKNSNKKVILTKF